MRVRTKGCACQNVQKQGFGVTSITKKCARKENCYIRPSFLMN
jgi:hypothetical protein